MRSPGWSWNNKKPLVELSSFHSELNFSKALAEYCPYGKPGDRLWVREARGVWQRGDAAPGGRPYDPQIIFKATDEPPIFGDGLGEILKVAEIETFKWRPSIHMPRRASRITLEVTDARVERVQDISEDDAKAEGVTLNLGEPGINGSYRMDFHQLWDSINESRGFV